MRAVDVIHTTAARRAPGLTLEMTTKWGDVGASSSLELPDLRKSKEGEEEVANASGTDGRNVIKRRGVAQVVGGLGVASAPVRDSYEVSHNGTLRAEGFVINPTGIVSTPSGVENSFWKTSNNGKGSSGEIRIVPSELAKVIGC